MENCDYTKKIYIFSDGAWWREKRCGAWGYILQWRDLKGKRHEDKLVGTATTTTNQRMEMIGAIMGLRAIPMPARVILITDSKYLKRGVTEWLALWRKRNWLTVDGNPVKNKELWLELERLNALHSIAWQWTKGHGGSKGNNAVDLLVRDEMKKVFGE